MTTIKPKPDYIFWSKLDSWAFKDAALLLHGIDPLEFKSLRFSTREVPNLVELKEAYKTFLIFKNVIWREQALSTANSAHLYEIYVLAVNKDLPIPDELAEVLQKRYVRENEKEKISQPISLSTNQQVTTTSAQELSTRERRALLKALGIMALLLTEDPKRSAQFKLSNRPNAFQIAQAVLDKASSLNMEPEGIKSLNRKIKEALELLAEEANVQI